MSRGDVQVKTTRFLKVIAVLLFLLLGGVIAFSVHYLRGQSERTTYFGKTLINGMDVSDQTPEEVLLRITGTYEKRAVSIQEKGELSISGTLAEFGYTLDENTLRASLEKALDMQKSDLWTLIGSLMNGNSFLVDVPYKYDEETFLKAVSVDALAEERFPSEDAELIFDKKKMEYRIQPEVYGNEFPIEKLQTLVKGQLDEFIKAGPEKMFLSIDMPTEDFYYEPAVKASDPEISNPCSIYNRYVKAKITYVFGSYKETLDWDTIKGWIDIVDGVGYLNEVLIYEYVERLAEKYNTRHKDRYFHTSIGTDIVIPSSENDYGYIIYLDGEFSQLLADIYNNTEVEREPVYFETNSTYGNPLYYARDGMDDLAGNYVEVNISMQHLWFYVDGGLVVDTDVVTGCVARNTETKTGCFPLAYKESPSVLVGADAANGYRTEVQYWMPFYDGQGLHDASWRGYFGGNVYLTNGSHGCVNMPYYAAQMVYNYIRSGMAIIIYK